MVATIAVALLFLGISGRQTYKPLCSINRNLPLVTLDVLEEEIHYAPEPYGPGINVNFRRWPLVPQEIHINSIDLWKNPGTVEDWMEADRIRNYDARMDFSYYHLLSENMARRMTEEEAAGMRESETIVMDDGFDEAWLSVSDWEYQTLWAREGDVVIKAFYKGSGDLRDVLPEIYEIVMDYRNT